MSASVLNYAADQRLLHMLGGDLLGSSQKENKGDCASHLAPPLGRTSKSLGQEAQVSQTSSQQNNFTQTQEK